MEPENIILPLDSSSATLELVGGKALSLAKLASKGYMVPSGFLLSTKAYQSFIRDNGFEKKILELLNQDLENSETLKAVSSKLSKLIVGGLIEKSLEDKILKAYSELTDDEISVAVRSSATAEDLPDMSFAGQQDSYLNVSGCDNLLHSIKCCWASLWSDRAIAYRYKMGVSHKAISMAVIIQKLIDAEVSGILFTANPNTGSRDDVLINANYGLGESVVGAQITPDSYIYSRTDSSVKESFVGTKEHRTVAAGQYGTELERLDKDLANKLCLDVGTIRRLVESCLAVEKLFSGIPQDIEWAYQGGKFWILQSRAITNLPSQSLENIEWKPPKPQEKYIRRQVVENMPDPLSPLFEDIYLTIGLERSIDNFVEKFDMGFDYREFIEPPFFVTLNGYAYCKGSYKMTPSIVPKIFYAYFTKLEELLRTVIPSWKEQGLPSYLSVIEEHKSIDLDSASEFELLKGIKALAYADALYWFDVAVVIGAAKVTDGLLNSFLAISMAKESLTSGVFLRGFKSKMYSAQIDLESIAKHIYQSNQLNELVSKTSANQLLEKLKSSPNGKDVYDRIMDYLNTYGHQIYSLDFVEQTQIEDPLPVLLSLKSLVKSGEFEAQNRQIELSRQRDEAIFQVESKLGILSKKIFRTLLGWANLYGPHREEALFYMGAAWPALRSMALELGRRLTKQGTIEWPDQIFFLTASEIEIAIRASQRGKSKPGFSDLAKQRNALREARKKLHPPGMVPPGSEFKVGPFDMSIFKTQKKNAPHSKILDGFAVSPGKVTGIATIITSAGQFENMKPGTILVCPTTTPAWTPLFAQAQALVTDIGGILAHGSIVAREYGIPAVMGTGNATKRIKDGQLISVDGNTGKVVIIE